MHDGGEERRREEKRRGGWADGKMPKIYIKRENNKREGGRKRKNDGEVRGEGEKENSLSDSKKGYAGQTLSLFLAL